VSGKKEEEKKKKGKSPLNGPSTPFPTLQKKLEGEKTPAIK